MLFCSRKHGVSFLQEFGWGGQEVNLDGWVGGIVFFAIKHSDIVQKFFLASIFLKRKREKSRNLAIPRERSPNIT